MARVQPYAGDGRPVRAGGYWTRQYPVDFWQENALRFPERDALVFGTRRFTWKRRSQAIDRSCRRLVHCGFAKDDVALQAPNLATLMPLRLAAGGSGVISLLVLPTFPRAEVGAIAAELCRWPARCCRIPSARTGRGLLSRGGALVQAVSRSANRRCRVRSTSSRLARSCVPGEPARSRLTFLALRVRGDHHDERHGWARLARRARPVRAWRPGASIDRLRLGCDDVVAAMVSVSAGNRRIRRAPRRRRSGRESCSSIASIRIRLSPPRVRNASPVRCSCRRCCTACSLPRGFCGGTTSRRCASSRASLGDPRAGDRGRGRAGARREGHPGLRGVRLRSLASTSIDDPQRVRPPASDVR